MKKFSVIFYGTVNNEIFSVDILADSWSMQKAGDNTVVKFLDEEGRMLGLFNYNAIVGICDMGSQVRHNNEEPTEVTYESVEM